MYSFYLSRSSSAAQLDDYMVCLQFDLYTSSRKSTNKDTAFSIQ